MILAIGNSGAYEVAAFKAVVEELALLGHDAVLFKQDKCLVGESLIFEVVNGVSQFSVNIDDRIYVVDDFSAIWYLKPHLPRSLMEFEPAEYRQFIHRQFLGMRTALWSVFREKKWIDDPWSVQRAEDKIFQLHLANRVGFIVPNTIITSDPDKVRTFYYANDGKIVVKILSSSPMIDKVIYTNKVSSDDLTRIESVKGSPAIFQSYISKKYELRITVVGEKIFATKVFSQGDESTSLDWRRKPLLNDYDVKMEPTLLPDRLERQILDYMGLLGLRYGCIDIIVTHDDQYVFLEINPNGQWYFVQLHTEVEIAKAIVGLLL